MKIIALLIFLSISMGFFGQAKQLNELLKQYALYKGQWEKYPPFALQGSMELIVPHFSGRDTLQVIKWKNIDSTRIIKFCEGSARIVVYGKVLNYKKSKTIGKGSVKYLGLLYNAGNTTDSVFIPIPSSIYFDGVIRKFKEVFHQLNNTPVNEYYEPFQVQTIPYNNKTYRIDLCFDCNCPKRRPGRGEAFTFYNDTTSEIVICYDSCDYSKPPHFSATELHNSKRLTILGLITPSGPCIVSSFDIYIGPFGNASHVFNEGGIFNEELLKLIKTVEKDDVIIFDMIRVKAPDGTIRTIQSPGFKVE